MEGADSRPGWKKRGMNALPKWSGIRMPPESSRDDGPRYKQMGNAVTVNVAEWIGKQIGKVI